MRCLIGLLVVLLSVSFASEGLAKSGKWRSYKNDKMGLHLSVPPKWEVADGSYPDVFLLLSPKGAGSESCKVVYGYRRKLAKVNLEDALKLASPERGMANFRTAYPDVKALEQGTDTLGGFTAHYQQVQFTQPAVAPEIAKPMRMLSYTTFANSGGYFFRCSAPADRFEQVLPVFETLRDSLKIVPILTLPEWNPKVHAQ